MLPGVGRKAIGMERYRELAKLMRAMAHPVRLQILAILGVKPAYVGKIIELTGRRQAYISQQLALLREAGLVACSREGLNVRYSLTQPRVIQLIESAAWFSGSGLAEEQDDVRKGKYPGEAWYGIPCEQIDWHPTVVIERCIGCGACAIACRREVYAFDYEQNRPVVVAPVMCTVGCMTCATMCVQDAVEFPSTGTLRQAIRRNKLLRQAKDLLWDGREKYDVTLRQTAAG
jgi:DNA-binding transcriptional ArsR family regulator/NAD-dependent dihydropyrimidine dehydrogenase PreA subunit